MAIKMALSSMCGAVVLVGLSAGGAQAGHPQAPAPTCSGIGNCSSGVAFMPAPRGHTGPMTVQNRTPYDFLDSIHFQRSPHVSITRVHGMLPSAGLSDAPVGFTGGCHPESTTYCRQSANTVGTAPMPQPVAPSPVPYTQIATPPARPFVQTERIVAIGGGYDASKFRPRIYGDPYTITPGIAHVPTSIVDRNPYRAQQVLDSGRAVYNPLTPGGITPAFAGVPVNTAPVPPRLPPHYAPRGGHISGYAGGYTQGYAGYSSGYNTGHYSASSSAVVTQRAPSHYIGPINMPAMPAATVPGRYAPAVTKPSVTCRHPGRYPVPTPYPTPPSPCAQAAAGKSRY